MQPPSERFQDSLTQDGCYRLLVEAVTDYAIYMLDPAGIVSSWNAGARRFNGYDATEIIGQHFSRFYTSEDREDGLPTRALQTAEREGKFEGEGWRVRKDGTRFWASVVIDAIRDPTGSLVGFAKVTRDLTERRDAQIELDRTREALFQSQKMDAIGQLTGGIAHDFNNLLMAIISSLELVQKRMPADDPKVSTFIDNAMRAGQRGAELVQRMLAFARRQTLKTGRWTFRFSCTACVICSNGPSGRRIRSNCAFPSLFPSPTPMKINWRWRSSTLRSMREMPCPTAARSPSKRERKS